MKLFELIDPKIQSKRIYASNARLQNVQNKMDSSDNVKYLGSGSYGQALAHKNRPNSVIKTGAVGNSDTDGYLRYITVASKLASSNPYLPRVYSIKTYKNDYEGKQKDDPKDMYAAEIEKLVKCDDTDPQTLIAIGDRAFFDFEQHLNANLRSYVGSKQGKGSPEGRKNRPTAKLHHLPQGRLMNSLSQSFDVSRTILELMQQAVAGDMTVVKDPHLKHALMLIKKLSNDKQWSRSPGHYDFRTPNIMVRPSPTGGQLVITDPIV